MNHHRPIAWSLLASLLLALPPLRAAERPLAELRQMLEAAVMAKEARVVIPPGVYRGAPEHGGKVHLTLRHAANLEIVAEGVTLLCSKSTRALDLVGCTNLTLRGLTVDYDPLPFTQGDIVALDPAAGWLDVNIHAGYPVEPFTRVDIVDRQTRFRKRDKPFMWESSAAVRTAGVVRVQNKTAAAFAQVGDLASLGGFPPGVIAHAVVISDSAHVTLERVTIHAANCMGVVAAGGEGAHRFLGCRIVPGSPPPGATEARILSVNADAILTSSLRQGVLTESCEIRDAGDDSWSVQSSDYVLLKREGQTLWLAGREGQALHVGDRLQAALGGPEVKVSACENISRQAAALAPEIQQKLESAAAWSFWKLGAGVCKVAVEGSVPWQAGDSVYDLDQQGNGFVFRNNSVRSSGRILVKASGLIESNRIEGPFALATNPEVPFPAAAGIAELVIRHNTIRDTHLFNPHYSSPQAGAISVTAEDGGKNAMRPAGVFGRVVIEGNTISGGNGAGIVISSAREVVIRGNRLEGLLHIPPNCTGAKYRLDNHAALWLAECDRVTLAGNKLVGPGPAMSRPLVCGEGVKHLDGDLTAEK
jgi:parallel beta-helix repeat protein